MGILKNLYNYRELLKSNIKKEIRGKYKHSFLGIIWSFLYPLLQLAVYAIVFPLILKVTQDNYVIFLCVGLIPWSFFVTVVTQSAGTIIINGNIIQKVYFPREILPISIVTSAAVNFLISTVIILIFVLFSGLGLSWYIIFYIPIFIIQYLLSIGIALLLSSITVYLRDLEHFISIAMTMLFYATPIAYSAKTLTGTFGTIMKFNPMAHIIEGYRDIFYSKTMPDFYWLGIVFVVSVVICILGYMIFNKLQRNFAEQL